MIYMSCSQSLLKYYFFDKRIIFVDERINYLSKPSTCSVLEILQRINANIHIIHYLKIEHPDTNEIGAIFKRPFEAAFWVNSACRKHLETHHRHLGTVDKLNSPIGERAKTVVVEHVVIHTLCSVYFECNAVFAWMRRPVVVVVHRFHVIIGNDTILFANDE